MMEIGVTVLITNWNGRKILSECLEHTRAAVKMYSGPTEIMVIDDASQDDSVTYVKEHYPEVRLIVNKENLGVGETFNVGFQNARYPLVLLLNNDCYMQGDYITPLVETYVKYNPRWVFAVMGQVFEKDGDTSAGGLSRAFIHHGLLRVRWADDRETLSRENYTFYATAGALFDRDKWKALGGIDPLFKPFYSEDVDISYRAWKRAWKIIYQPRAKLIHNQGTTIRSNFSKRLIRHSSQKNRFIFFYKNIDDLPFRINHFFSLPFRFLEYIVKAEWRIVASLVEIIVSKKRFSEVRRSESMVRRLTDRDILQITSRWNSGTKGKMGSGGSE